MTEYYGNGCVFQFVGTAGTLDMSADLRSVTFSPTGQMDDVTTGSEAYKHYLTTLKDFTVSYKGLAQAGTAAAGSAVEDYLAWGQVGTIYCYPQGTGTSYRKYTWPVISQGVQQNFQYNALTEVNVSFQGNGTVVYGTA